MRREPSTCARCRNFSVAEKHRGYWLEQARRAEVRLNEPAMPTQMLKVARARVTEALTILRLLDAKAPRTDGKRRCDKILSLGSPNTSVTSGIETAITALASGLGSAASANAN